LLPVNPVAVAKRLSALRRSGRIDALTCQVGLVLLWECRAPGRDEAQVSYARLAELTGIGITKTKEAVATLKRLGVLTWRRTRLRIAWGAGVASRQWRNVYLFLAPATEVAARPTDSRQLKKQRCEGRNVVVRALRTIQRALAGRHEDRESVEQQDERAKQNAKRQLIELSLTIPLR
jgi:hypothetical protein